MRKVVNTIDDLVPESISVTKMADKQGASSSRPLFTRKEAPSDARRCQSFGARPIPPPKSTILCSSMQPSNSPSLSRLGMGSSQIHAGARSALNRPTAPPVPPKPQLIPRKHKSTEEGLAKKEVNYMGINYCF